MRCYALFFILSFCFLSYGMNDRQKRLSDEEIHNLYNGWDVANHFRECYNFCKLMLGESHPVIVEFLSYERKIRGSFFTDQERDYMIKFLNSEMGKFNNRLSYQKKMEIDVTSGKRRKFH